MLGDFDGNMKNHDSIIKILVTELNGMILHLGKCVIILQPS